MLFHSADFSAKGSCRMMVASHATSVLVTQGSKFPGRPFSFANARPDYLQAVVTTRVSLDCNNKGKWDCFPAGFARVFDFPDFQGKNMNARIDCVKSWDAPDGMPCPLRTQFCGDSRTFER